jgi:hypothetical protein
MSQGSQNTMTTLRNDDSIGPQNGMGDERRDSLGRRIGRRRPPRNGIAPSPQWGNAHARKHGHASTHGRAASPTYKTWLGIKKRCFDPKYEYYEYYAGRGITVCERWKNSFSAFLEDVRERPPGLSIDRIDNDKGYSCGRCAHCASHGWLANCRWATPKEQANNRRRPKRGKERKAHLSVTCAFCSDSFKTSQTTARYCTDRCRVRARRQRLGHGV